MDSHFSARVAVMIPSEILGARRQLREPLPGVKPLLSGRVTK